MSSRISRSLFKANKTVTKLFLNILLIVLLVLLLIPSVFASSSTRQSHKKTFNNHHDNKYNNGKQINRDDALFVNSPPHHLNPVSKASILPSPAPHYNQEYVSHSSSFVGSLINDGTLDNWAVDNFILVSTIDGSLHALDRQTGLELWSIPGEKPLVQVSTAESLKNISKSSTPGSSSCPDCDVIWITEPIGDGKLYIFKPENGLQELTVSFKELVQTPYAFDKEDKMITGSHHTTLYSIESKTGKILKVYGSENLASACPPRVNPFYSENYDINDTDDEPNKVNHSFKIGRTGNYYIYVAATSISLTTEFFSF